MDAATREYLVKLAAELGQALSAGEVDRLDRYHALLVQWNEKVNVTSVVEERAVVQLHFADSLAVCRLLGEAASLIDVGAGAGFPGMVIALVRPKLPVLCLEAVQKKVAFMRAVQREVAPNVEAVWGRLEAFPATRQFDAAVSRATWEPQEWLRRGASLVKPGGRIITMQGSEQPPLTPPPEFSFSEQLDYRAGHAARRLVAFTRG